MLRKVCDIVMTALLLLVCVAGHATTLAPYPTAKVTVNGTEQLISGSWDNANITIDFNGYLETVHYGQYSSDASLASALAAMFTRDYLSFGLYAKAGANSNTDPTVITFQLTNGSSFGPLNVTGPSTSFTFATSGFTATPSGTPDQGTATLLFNGAAIATVSYGDGSTPASIAQDLALKASSSLVTVTAEGPNVYLQSKQTGTYSDTYSLSFSTSLSFSSSPGGTLSGTSETKSVPVYSYSVTNSSGQSGYDAAGNLKNVTDSVMGTWSYNYDNLNRLISGHASSGSYAGQYICWSYDSFGNRTHQSISNQSFVNAAGSPCQAATGASLIDTAVNYGTNNQISSVPSPALTVGYDGAGNVTNDGNNSYLYDAEGRICAVNGPQGMTGYQYDAAGNRVGRGTITSMSCDVTSNGYSPTTDFVLDQGGEQMTEVAVSGGTQTWVHTNVIAKGALIATYDTTGSGLHFYLNDALGSRRVQTDPAGFPEQTCQNLPFGDQLYCTGSLTFPTEHHFTGKERDTESGLDYFGARYYGSMMGRFTSPDWASSPEALPYSSLDNPQSLNLYIYANNNPLNRDDPDGHDSCIIAQADHHASCLPDGTPIPGSSTFLAADGTDGSAPLPQQTNDNSVTVNCNCPQPQPKPSWWKSFGSWLASPFRRVFGAKNEGVTAAADATGFVGMFAPKVTAKLHLGPLSAGVSITNDPSKLNVITNLLGLTDLYAAPMAITGAFNDFLDWGANNSSPGPGKAYDNSGGLQPQLPTQDDGCEAAGADCN